MSRFLMYNFGAFQIKMHMASREKYIFHMLFGAFHITPGMLSEQIGINMLSEVFQEILQDLIMKN